MARALIVGCGCRGRLLGTQLLEEGWAVRGTSRSEGGLEAIEKAGIEPALADPQRPGTLLDLVGDVAIVHWLLGSARGDEEALADVHGELLERLLERLVDTPVRGFVYEGVGTIPGPLLERGANAVSEAGRVWRIPVEILDVDPADPVEWLGSALSATLRLTAGPTGQFPSK